MFISPPHFQVPSLIFNTWVNHTNLVQIVKTNNKGIFFEPLWRLTSWLHHGLQQQWKKLNLPLNTESTWSQTIHIIHEEKWTLNCHLFTEEKLSSVRVFWDELRTLTHGSFCRWLTFQVRWHCHWHHTWKIQMNIFANAMYLTVATWKLNLEEGDCLPRLPQWSLHLISLFTFSSTHNNLF